MQMTLAVAKARLRESRMTIRKRDGEYRVNYKDGKEDDAYYTSDLEDAVVTGEEMRQKRQDIYFVTITQEEGGLSRSNYTRDELLAAAKADGDVFKNDPLRRKFREYTQEHFSQIISAKVGDEIQLNMCTYVFCLKGPKPKEVT